MEETDVSDWRVIAEEPMGRRDKWWLKHPDSGELWLWKERTYNNDAKRGVFAKGDDWAEWVAARLADSLGVPTSRVALARRKGSLGTITRSFRESVEQELQPGNELLAGVDPAYPTSGPGRHDPGYTVQAVLDVVRALEAPVVHPVLTTAVDWFMGYLVLDAWIGNTDRHHENWGALKTGGARLVLAPSYDHASSMGFLLSDEERTERLGKTKNMLGGVEWWAERAPTPFAGVRGPQEAARTAMEQVDVPVARHWLAALEAAQDSAAGVLEAVPAGRMSLEARAFAGRLLEHNAARMVRPLF